MANGRSSSAAPCGLKTARGAPDAVLRGEYQRDESEQVRYMQELNQIFAEEGLDLAFWFTFAGYHQPASTDPRRDVDLASYGLVSMLPEGPGSGYQGLGWRPRLAFEAMAKLEAG
jgi:hypothetical protein